MSRWLRATTAGLSFFLGASAAQASAPLLDVPAPIVFREGDTNNLTTLVLVTDYSTSETNLSLTASSSATNVAAVFVTATNVLTGENGAVFALTFAPVPYAHGATDIRLVAGNRTATTTNQFTLTITAVNQPPRATLATNLLLSAENAGAVTISNILTGLSAGPTNESNQTLSFIVSSTSNLVFKTFPAVVQKGTTANLTFAAPTNTFGTNTITVIVKDSGATTNGGINACTNTFDLGVYWVDQAPHILWATNQAVLEDVFSNAIPIQVCDVDTDVTNLTFQATTTNSSLLSVLVTGRVTATQTNLLLGTNAVVFTIVAKPATNMAGDAWVQVKAMNITGWTTNGPSSLANAVTNTFKLTISPVDQPPSVTMPTNLLLSAENAGTVTISNVLTSLSTGPANETNQSLSFIVSSTSNFAYKTFPSFAQKGASANLTFAAATNVFGTNTITVVTKDSGTTNNGGINTCTNTFTLGVYWVNQAPRFGAVSNLTVLENGTKSATVSLYDVDTAWTNLTLNAYSSNSALATVTAGTAAQGTQTNLLVGTNAANFTVTLNPLTNANGTLTIALVGSDGNSSITNKFTLTILVVDQPPSVTMPTNLLLSAENAGTVTISNVLTSLSTGPANETNQTLSFIVSSTSNFAYKTFPSFAQKGASANLTFAAATNVFGTNTITVVTKDSGTTNNGGINTCTNTFTLGVYWVDQAPHFGTVSNLTVLENGTKSATISLYDVDTAWTSLTLNAYSSNSALATVTVGSGTQGTQTNLLVGTNAANFAVTVNPLTNVNGTLTIALVGSDGTKSITNKFALTITAVDQPPSAMMTTNLLLSPENAGLVTISNVLTSLSNGPTNESSQKLSFIVSSTSNFAYKTFPSFAQKGTSANFTFAAATNVFGTNTITVVTKDSGTTNNGGINTCTNTFTLGVYWVNQAPHFGTISNLTVLENSTTNVATISLYDVDTPYTSLTLNAYSSNTSIATVSLLGYGGPSQIQNGGFESATNWVASSWTSTGEYFDVIESASSSQTNIHSGSCSYEMGTVNGDGLLSQTVPTVAGQVYQLQFWLKNDAGPESDINNNFNLFWNGSSLIGVTNVSSFDWTLYSYNVTATGASSDIQFLVRNDPSFFYLDDVALLPLGGQTNLLVGTNAATFAVALMPVHNVSGTVTIGLVGSDGTSSITNKFTLTITPVDQPPSVTMPTNLLLSAENAGTVTISNVLTSLSNGPTNESKQTLSFIVSSTSNFAYKTFPSFAQKGTSANLTFAAATNVFGTNTITVVTKDSGTTANGGINTCTNTFTLGVYWVDQAPRFGTVSNLTVLENGTKSATVSLYDVDTAWSSLTLNAYSSNSALATVTVGSGTQGTQTNLLVGTNAANFAVTVNPLTNVNGTLTIALVGSDGTKSITNKFTLTITAVDQPPSAMMTTNLLLSPENAGLVTISNVLTSLSNGPTNESKQTLSFIVSSTSNFAYKTFPSFAQKGTSANLTFAAATNVFGTNTITVVTKDSGPTANGGINTCTNTFTLGVYWVNQAPHFGTISNLTVLENSATTVASINLYDVDTAWTSLTLNAYSSNTALATVSVNMTTNGGANLIVDGGFEGDSSAWVINGLIISAITNGPSPQHSGQVYEAVGTEFHDGFVSQTVPTVAGQTYRIQFWTRNLYEGDQVNDFNVYWNEGQVFAKTNWGPFDWTQSGADVVATSSSSTIKFGIRNDPGYFDIDDITMVSVTASTQGTQTNLLVGTNAASFAVALSPVHNANGVTTIALVGSDGIKTITNKFTLTVLAVDQPPSVSMPTNLLLSAENAGTVTISNVLTSLSTGPANETNQSLSFIVSSTSNFAYKTFPSFAQKGASANFTFAAATNVFGTNTITVVTKDSGTTNNGGINTCTNTFTLGVYWVDQAPRFGTISNLTVLENGTKSATVSLYDVDTAWTSLTLNAYSSNSALATVTVGTAAQGTQTNLLVGTNAANFAVTVNPLTNVNGTLTIALVGSDGTKSITNKFTLTITPVDQPPSATGPTSIVLSPENAGSVTISNVLTSLSNGPTNESSQTLSFIVSSTSNFAYKAFPSFAQKGTSANLIFAAATNVFGTNTITVVTKDSGTTNNGGINTCTNTFDLGVYWVNQAPHFGTISNLTVLENGTNSAVVSLYDVDTAWTNLTLNAYSSNTSLATVTVGTATRGTQANLLVGTNAANFTVTVTPLTNVNGTLTIALVGSDGTSSITNKFTLTITPVDQAPSATGPTSIVLSPENAGSVTISNVLTSLSNGPTNESSQKLSFIVSSTSNFAYKAFPSFAQKGTSANLTFAAATNVFGTNTITVVTTDSGTTANGGVNTCTNTFDLGVYWVNQAPHFGTISNLTVFENGTNSAVVSLYDVDTAWTNLTLNAYSSNTALATVTVGTATRGTQANLLVGTNAANFTVTVNPLTNVNGTLTIALVGSDGTSSITNKFTLTITAVDQPPSATGPASIVLSPENAGSVTISNVLTSLSNGPANESSQTLSFTVSSTTNFAYLTFPSFTQKGTSANLTFAAATNTFGTNTITVVTTDSGTTANGGVNTCTNTFDLGVYWVNQAPTFGLAISKVTVDKYNVAVSIANVVTNLVAGPGAETNQTLTLTVSNSVPGLFDVVPSISLDGTLTFTPASTAGTNTVTVVAQDSGGTANGGKNTSASHSFSIVIPANPFTTLTGSFAGLFFDANTLADASSGYFQMTLAPNGGYSGHVLSSGGLSNQITGQFGIGNPVVSVVVTNAGCTLTMSLQTNGTKSISGTAANSTGGWSVPLQGFLNVYSSGSPTTLAGEYLVAAPGNQDPTDGPSGDSILNVRIAGDGTASVAGYIADDTFATQNSQLCVNGHFPMYVPLTNGVHSTLSGWLTFTNHGLSAVTSDSLLVTIKESGGILYTNGCTNSSVALASLYDSTKVPLLAITNGTVVLSGGDLTTPITNTVTIANNLITVDPTATNGLTLTIDSSLGQIEGQFTAPDGSTNQINSVILQSTKLARGYFIGTNQCGAFILK